ncbi:MAG: hypothetical protein K2X27_22435 [Candidatus Obscuribacterales bacterium]|nr:hypothetical protein [Candidatus Obscuribacterales bacterium]
MRSAFKGLFAVIAMILSASIAAHAANPLRFEVKKTQSGEKYKFIFTNDAEFGFTTRRPDKNDQKILLSIPAAFTLKDDSIDGVYICDGKVHNINGTDAELGGALSYVEGKLQIFPTSKGKLLTRKYLDELAARKAIFFQQFQVIENGKAAKFRDKSKFIRRGVGIMKNGQTVIVESHNAIELGKFGQDLLELGLQNLLYTDMGAWSEGWVRNPKDGKTVRLGEDTQLSNKQSNWLVLKDKEHSKAD